MAPLLTLTALLAVLAGCSGTTAGQGLYLGAGSATTSGSETTSSSPPTSTAPTTTAETSTTADTTTSSPSPPPATTSAPPPPSGAPPSGPEGLTDDSWVVESFEYSDGGIGLFSGTARIRNDVDTARSALYTFTLFDGEAIVATFIGSSSEVAPGDSVTVSLISGDDYVEGEFSVDFQVDFSF